MALLQGLKVTKDSSSHWSKCLTYLEHSILFPGSYSWKHNIYNNMFMDCLVTVPKRSMP